MISPMGLRNGRTDRWVSSSISSILRPACRRTSVLAQVQVSRVLRVKKGFNVQAWNNRINRLSYDFVVCSKDATVLAAIELDDKTHESASRTDTDAKKERATHAAGVRLIRWHVRSLPDEQTIRAAFPPKSLAPDGTPDAVDKRLSSP